MEILIGWLHDSYTDENGKEVSYTDKVVGWLDDEVMHCTSIPDFMTFDMPKEEFLAKVTGIKKGAEIWN